MQLTIEVLPAPFGPMIENNSPSSTPKLTSVSARTPPKRSDTPRTSKACSTHSLPRVTSGCEIRSLTEDAREQHPPVSLAVIAAHPVEPTMVGRFNILDYWAQLAQRPIACWSFAKNVKQCEIFWRRIAVIRYRIGTETHARYQGTVPNAGRTVFRRTGEG